MKDYEEIKNDLYEDLSVIFHTCDIKINDMFTEDFNALEISISGNVVDKNFLNFKYIKEKFMYKYDFIITDIDFIPIDGKKELPYILIYLNTEENIRKRKISKISQNI